MSRIVVGMLLSFAVTTVAEGQGIGGMIRKKVGEATKPKEEAKPAAPETSPFQYELDETSMASFKRGLELEVKMREDYKSRLAKQKTPQQYNACTTETATSPDAMKVMEEYGKRTESAKTPEESQKVTTWFGETLGALVQKRCGDEPQKLINEQNTIFRKAEEAGALEFAKGWTRASKPDESPEAPFPGWSASYGLEGDDDSPIPMHLGAERIATTVTGERQGTDAETEKKKEEYRKTKELLEKYCSLSQEMRTNAQEHGITVPGQGTNINWVFSKGFAIWVGDDCDHLMKLFSHLQ